MKNLILVFTACLSFAYSAFSQRAEPDKIATANGEVTVQPILHGTVALTWNNKSIYVDPYGGAKAFEGIQAPDLILITDIHGDHMNLETLNDLETKNAILIVPQAVKDKLPEDLQAKSVVVANGASTEQLGIDVMAMPMYNLPEDADSRHTKGRGNGYVLTVSGKRIYFSGDTEDIPEMRALENIDVAFICMNQPYTMNIEQATSAVLEFKPKIVYPYHYRGSGGLSDTEAFKKNVNAGDNNIEVRLKNWYPKY